jgi:hypothetical protein
MPDASSGITFNMMVNCREAWKPVIVTVTQWIYCYKDFSAAMLMETFDQLFWKEKYVWDVSNLLHVLFGYSIPVFRCMVM